MGRKEKWFSAVKKALSHSKEKNDQKLGKSKRKWFRKKKGTEPSSSSVETAAPVLESIPPTDVKLPILPPEGVKLAEVETEQAKHAFTVEIRTDKGDDQVGTAAVQAAAEVAPLSTAKHFAGKSKEELAAIEIQAAFRGYLARRQLHALQGLARLKTLMQGQSVKRQTTNTLKCMQTLARLQSQMRARRLRMAEENQARMRQLMHKHAKENEKSQMGENWDHSLKSKEQIEAVLQNRQEAAVRRQRAMAYAFNHQQTWRKSTSSANTMFIDPNNPHWGWCWLERWLAARPWETANIPEKEPNNDVKSSKHNNSGGEVTNAHHRGQLEKPSQTASQKQTHSTGRLSTSTPPSKVASPRSVTRKLKPRSPKENPKASPRMSFRGPEDDSRSLLSVHSDDHCRRHSNAGSSIRDDESLASSPALPSYMAPTQSAKAKTHLGSPSNMNKNSTPDRLSVSSAKRRLSYPTSPARSRHSISSMTDATSIA
ncbi:hypothetical protein Ancab_014667 [Ancistrocladus abbreviatus]